jgi:hypothetical protein
MAVGKYCDVFGKGREARGYQITITDLDFIANGSPLVFDATNDLCPEALERLVKRIMRALEKPAKRKGKAVDNVQ